MKLFLIPALALAGALAQAQTTIVDIIPATMQTERAFNAEPNIAVNPCDPTKIIISAFGSSARKNPLFISKDGGTSWALLQNIPSSDTSVAWGGPYNAYMANLSPSGTTMAAWRLHDPTIRSSFRPLRHGLYHPRGDGPDQPWVEATFVNGVDRIYVGFNDLTQPTKTASVRFSLDGGATWQSNVIERITPGDGADGSAVRVAASGDKVYAAFQRFNQLDANEDEVGDVIIMRDDSAGTGGFNALGTTGVTVSADETLPQGSLGQERLGSDLSIAVDPGNSSRVAVAFAAISNGLPIVVLRVSNDSGATWTEVFATSENCALPAVAIAANGTIGLLYTKLSAGNFETHLVQSKDTFNTNTDLTLSRFADASLTPDSDPYIGDYEDLVAVDNTFYGTFSASNDTSLFPAQPVFLRDKTKLGVSVPFSIDPFFFKTPAL